MTMPPPGPQQQPAWPSPDGYPVPPMPPQQPRNGLGVAALVVGIVGVVFGILPPTFWLGGVLGLLGLIFGVIGIGRARKGEATNKGMALTGVITGSVAMVLAIVWVIALAFVITEAVDQAKKDIASLPSAPANPAEPGTGGPGAGGPGAGGPGAGEPDEEGTTEPLALGETLRYDDGVEITVGKPSSYTPDQYAQGHKKGDVAIQLQITIKNGGKKSLSIGTALPTLKDAKGREVEMIFDGSNATNPFQGTLLPGKQAEADFAFSVPADAANEIQLEVSPSVIEYDDGIWTGAAK
ncbi:DUF4352 domain-containing protein [Streptomyces sp. NPDC047928]|uniref:DUF4352 domain-containing protein n=1 Tax=unclassified Streptomyces TaxID=2593676 RepID=UPI003715B8BF